MDSLPKIKGLSNDQQARLDAELTARQLTHIGHMKQRPNEVLAALQFALAVDVQAIYAAYGDAEAQARERAFNAASIERVNSTVDMPASEPIKRGRRAPLNPDKEN